MIPALKQTSTTQALYSAFIKDLKNTGFEGEMCLDYANRTVLATDNSIYQIIPQGVIYPKHLQDLLILTKVSHTPVYCSIVLSPRGGGTGTNGQSLTDGLVVDTSKHMNQILEINVKERWARVQCGVVKDQLNTAVKEQGLFFAPELSTSNRATIGGMINTDASGQGSCAYGKTRDHVLELSTVLMDGSLLESKPITNSRLVKEKKRQDLSGEIYRVVDNIHNEHKEEIEHTFPKLNRCLTGYDLAHIRTKDGKFDLNSILCGSEGTLGFIAEAKLNLLPIPKYTALVNIRYDDFDSSLRDAKNIMETGPTSIETIDSRVLNLAKQDLIWNSISDFFPHDEDKNLAGINLVEYTADTKNDLKQKMKPLMDLLIHGDNTISLGFSIAWDEDVKKIWGMRKKAVGLLGNTQGEARPVAFVEDTAVPPENLADYIQEFRALLDSYDLQYGMFGHVDAGVLHVRPILDMKQPKDESLVRKITDQVVELTHKYGGLLWGEHGKGVRSEYSPKFFGALYPLLQQIKRTFDPRYQLNPGKIATPNAYIPLLKIDKVPTRGQYDKKISVESWNGYKEAVFCNGNGVCHSWDPSDAMCPSWKGTRLRTHTPKGRASLIREWLLQLNKHDTDAISETEKLHKKSWLGNLFSLPTKMVNSLGKAKGSYDFSHEIHESMMGCLACKSCTGSCPIKVDVPEFRSKFLELYYGRYLRPLKDRFVGSLETMLPIAAYAPGFYNFFMGSRLVKLLLEKTIGLSDSPLLSTIHLNHELNKRNIRYTSAKEFGELNGADKRRSVIIVQDAFTRFFETQLILDTIDLLIKLDYIPWLAPFSKNGKPLHVHGFRKKFTRVATKTSQQLNLLASTGIPLVGLEPSMTLAYRGEYEKVLGTNAPKVFLIQEWLVQQDLPEILKGQELKYKLLAHCTEKTNAPSAISDWQTIFEKLGAKLENINVGCCGMAGTYGHETNNLKTSKHIYSLSWEQVINDPTLDGKLVASGFSCRSQVKRIDGKVILNPIQVLLT
ncbi:MAG: FAD/FMN-containing dehydrogenase/Fe-S oxidoreductase [Cellvibrionaceae bacterium]|jgi:FAD/FMN-containing dehydrogenase/Fe-S oxidoreductase